MTVEGDVDDRVTGGLVEVDGHAWYRIERLDLLAPFLTMLVSDVDLWAFVSTAGTLTAGRVDADGALLPYETDDRLHRAAGITGPVTLLARTTDTGRELWRPYARRLDDGCTRAMAREVTGTAMVLEETNPAWGMTVRTTWAPAPDFGWVRTVELVDDRAADGAEDDDGTTVEVLDGLLDVMPPGVDVRTEATRSNLVDAYKRSETVPGAAAALFALESMITDLAEPAEALAATLAWSHGLPSPTVLLDERAVEEVTDGRPPTPTDLLTGRRGSFLVHDEVTVPAGGDVSWTLVVDTGLGHAELDRRLAVLREPDAWAAVARDVEEGAARVRSLVDAADAEQATGDPVADAHHRSNVLFNTMRGGVFPHVHAVPTDDLRRFVATRNRDVADRHGDLLAGLPDGIDVTELRARADATGDPDLVRLVHGYLPLTFSRRHGDPSRPWNQFSIRVTDAEGDELLTYEGNWRDIFQNWEALLRSYPAWSPHVVATFVDATTVDGHNAYRISRDGIDWEVPDEDDPWSNIGYWGDHQLVYLLRLLRGWLDVDPDGPTAWLPARRFSYADVPYDLATHEQMLADPRDTVTYDEAHDAVVDERVERVGADGRLVHDAAGDVVHVTFLEKLLVPALAKLCAYVAGGGIWMNTQRPEWNDANNALAGYGLSMVTLFHLEQYAAAVGELLASAPGDDPVTLSRPVATWLRDTTAALRDAVPEQARDDDHARRVLLDALGGAATTYRAAVADGFDDTPEELQRDEVATLLGLAADHLGATVATSRRPDGLFESYSLVDFPDASTATVTPLQPMLEGQVAALGSTAVADDEVRPFVATMVDSALHRPDLQTFLLYPAEAQPPFLERNRLPADRAERLGLPADLVGPGRVLEPGSDDALHFRRDLRNAAALAAALDEHGTDGDVRDRLLATYEDLFDHHAFTGRSSGMHGYEGLGSVYWHMVSKLLVALEERFRAAADRGAEPAVLDDVAAAYRRVRDGLGFRHDPVTFGAIPTDCYSHSPAHSGAQQPGMTGQVKEQVLVRLTEAGLTIEDGRLRLVDSPLTREQLVDEAADPPGWTVHVCGTPVRVVLGRAPRVSVEGAAEVAGEHDGRALSPEQSAALFARDGRVTAVTLTTPQWHDG